MCMAKIYYNITLCLFLIVLVALVTALMRGNSGQVNASFQHATDSTQPSSSTVRSGSSFSTSFWWFSSSSSTSSSLSTTKSKIVPSSVVSTGVAHTKPEKLFTTTTQPPKTVVTVTSKDLLSRLFLTTLRASTTSTEVSKTPTTNPKSAAKSLRTNAKSSSTTATVPIAGEFNHETIRTSVITANEREGMATLVSTIRTTSPATQVSSTTTTLSSTNVSDNKTESAVVTTKTSDYITTMRPPDLSLLKKSTSVRSSLTTSTASPSSTSSVIPSTPAFTSKSQKLAFVGPTFGHPSSWPTTTTSTSTASFPGSDDEETETRRFISMPILIPTSKDGKQPPVVMDPKTNMPILLTEEGMLKNYLFSRYGLHISDRPVIDYDDTVFINIKFELLRFLHIDDLRGSMAVLGIVVITWENPFLAWQGVNITGSHIHRLALKSGEVWTPLILHLNNVKELTVIDKYGRGRGNMVMEIFENGTQLWPPTGIYESSCDLNFTFFPLDTQTCTFVFESWLSESLVNISSATALIHDNKTFVSKSQIWEFRSLSAKTEIVHYDGTPYSQAWVIVSLRRRHAYYTWNILIPCGSLSLLQLSTFALPPETPERASFSVTVLVAFGILQTIIKSEIPTTSDTVLLVIYVVGQLSIGTLATFYVVVSVGLASPYQFPSSMPTNHQYRKHGGRKKLAKRAFVSSDNSNKDGEAASSAVSNRLLPNLSSSPGARKRRNNDNDHEQCSSDEDLSSSNNHHGKVLNNLQFLHQPILTVRTIRIMDACAFSVLAIATFVGHICVYGLLHSADSDDQ